MVILFVDLPTGQLLLDIDNHTFVVDDGLSVSWRLVGAEHTDLDWHLRLDGEAELAVKSRYDNTSIRYESGPSDTVPLALDTSAFVEYEDFDFGLYLTNMIEKKTFREYARAAAG